MMPARNWIRNWGAAVAGRVFVLLLTVLAACFLTVVMVRMAPGFGIDERQFDLRLSEQSVEALEASRASPGLLSDFASQLRGLATGDWGVSISLGRPVRELVAERARLTLRNAGAGLAAAWILSLAACAALELLRRRWLESAAAVLSGGLLCLPAAVVAILFLYIGAGPAAGLALILFPRVFRYARNILAATAAMPHVLAARARGVGAAGLLWRHISIPSAAELLALVGVSASMAAGAAIAVEALCDSPGLGQLAWESAMARDLPVLAHMTVLIALITCGMNLLADAARVLAGRAA